MKPAEQLLIQFCEAYKKRDLPGLLKLISRNFTTWGTGLDEYFTGLEGAQTQAKRDWSQSEKGEMEIISFVPSPADALWAAALCTAKITIDAKEYVFENLRGTITIEKEDGMWKIAHMHASFPDFRNPENGSFPVNG